MKVVVACDSYKGCMTSMEVNEVIAKGFKDAVPECEVITVPIGDGGEGTCDAFESITRGERIEVEVVDAYFKKIKALYILSGNTAFFEIASIIGLTMVERGKRNPFMASSYGVGLMIKEIAKNPNVKRLIIALGGSSTNDGGLGVLQALGVKFFDRRGNILSAQPRFLSRVESVDFSHCMDLGHLELIAACDVKNHLLGREGCTYVFGKQKGIYPNQFEKFDHDLFHYSEKIRLDSGFDLNACEGGGAAGGIGSVLLSIFHARMIPGFEVIFEVAGFDRLLSDCDLVITGEGQTDLQTRYGKAPMGVLQHAKLFDKPVIIISGALGLEYMELYKDGFSGIYSIADRAMTFQQALSQAAEKLYAFSYGLMKTIDEIRKQ